MRWSLRWRVGAVALIFGAVLLPTAASGNSSSAVVSGHVTDANHPNGVANVCVSLIKPLTKNSFTGEGYTFSDSDGNWSITESLPTGTNYRVLFFSAGGPSVPSGGITLTGQGKGCGAPGPAPNDLNQLYKGVNYGQFPPSLFSGTPVKVSNGTTTSGINGVLVVAGALVGKVTDADHPGGLAGVCVSASGFPDNANPTITDSRGSYMFRQLQTGDYLVDFDPTCGKQVATPDLFQIYRSGAEVHVVQGATTSGINATLKEQPHVLTQGAPKSAKVRSGHPYAGSLTVTNAKGVVSYTQLVQNVAATLVTVNTAGAIRASSSLAAGTYVISGTARTATQHTGYWRFTLTVTG